MSIFRGAFTALITPMLPNGDVDFEGLKFPAPAKWDQYLRLEYGDYMTPPPEDKRNSGHTLLYIDTNKNYTEYTKK